MKNSGVTADQGEKRACTAFNTIMTNPIDLNSVPKPSLNAIPKRDVPVFNLSGAEDLRRFTTKPDRPAAEESDRSTANGRNDANDDRDEHDR